MGSLSVRDFLRHVGFIALSQLCKKTQKNALRQLIILLSLVAQIPFILCESVSYGGRRQMAHMSWELITLE